MSIAWIRLTLCALLTFVIATGAATAGPPTVTPGPSQPVQVTNTSANPVPVSVQGSTTVTGNVQVTNTPNVNVASTVFVQQAGIPYSFDKVATCNNFNCFADFPTVPAGKLLVITHMSALARPTLSTTIFDLVELEGSNTIDTDFATRYTFPMTRIGQAGDNVIADTWGANAQLLAFVLAGQFPRVTMSQRNQGETFFAQVTLAGYLVTAPQ
jgi:hypothetical protein